MRNGKLAGTNNEWEDRPPNALGDAQGSRADFRISPHDPMLSNLARFLDPWEAYVLRARLEADGIPATVAFANHAIANWPMSLALGGTLVQVPTSFLEQSRAILAQYEAGALEEELDETVGSTREHCPRCGSTDFMRTMLLRKRMFALVICVVFAPFPSSRSRFVCQSCGCEWDWGEG